LELPGGKLRGEQIPDQQNEIFTSGRLIRKFRILIQVMVIEAIDDPLRHDSVKLNKVETLPPGLFSAPSHGDKEHIVVPMPVRIVALPERGPVFLGRQMIGV
jgi:hypothetical protein